MKNIQKKQERVFLKNIENKITRTEPIKRKFTCIGYIGSYQEYESEGTIVLLLPKKLLKVYHMPRDCTQLVLLRVLSLLNSFYQEELSEDLFEIKELYEKELLKYSLLRAPKSFEEDAREWLKLFKKYQENEEIIHIIQGFFSYFDILAKSKPINDYS